MPYCKKCGADLPEHALFCPKCGVESPLLHERENELEQTTMQVEQENPAVAQSAEQAERNKSSEPKKPLGITAWIKENLMPLYVILGVVAYVLLQFSTTVATSAFGLGVTFAVFAILCALAFCVVGAIKFFTADIAANNNKHSTSDIICFALGIIGFVYVLVMSIVVLVQVGNALDSLNDFANMFK